MRRSKIMGLLGRNRQLQLPRHSRLRADAFRLTVATERTLAATSETDDELSLRQLVIMLLQTAAEIEHALLVQYLFAAYSLKQGVAIPEAPGRTTSQWRTELVAIAKEEMGHLLCVQNCLRALGAPQHFGRDNFPIQTGLYPFPFQLERVSLPSIARYVAAEMPARESIPANILSEQQLDRITTLSGGHVNRVGILFALLNSALQRLPTDAVRIDRDAWQERASDWKASDELDPPLLGIRVLSIVGGSPEERLSRIQEIVRFIADQGESPETSESDSHFERFARIFRELEGAGIFDPSLPLASNPNTTSYPDPNDELSKVEAAREQELAPGRLRNPTTRLWAKLFNLRYRILLNALAHSCASGPLKHPQSGESARDILRSWIFQEMHDPTGAASLRSLAAVLSSHRIGDAGTANAGPTFELPYSLQLPDRGPERWTVYLDLFDASRSIADQLLRNATQHERDLLESVVDLDGANTSSGRRAVVNSWLAVDLT